MPWVRVLGAGLLLVAACRAANPAGAPAPETKTATPSAPRPTNDAALIRRITRGLPDTAPPFEAGPMLVESGYVRRRYQRGEVSAEVTIAVRPQNDGEYQQWVTQSRPYPQASLPLPAAVATGFFTCVGPGTSGACDLHIQMRAGFHVEVMGGGRATRSDLDQLMAHIPLAALID